MHRLASAFTSCSSRSFCHLSFAPSSSSYSRALQRRHLASSGRQLGVSTAVKATNSSSSLPPPPISRLRIVVYSAFFLAAGFAMAFTPGADVVAAFMNAPSDAETLELFKPASESAAEVEAYIQSHPLTKSLRANPANVEARPHMKIPAALRTRTLTSGTLIGDELMPVLPLVFHDKTAALPTLTTIVHAGPGLCGYPGIVHGGLLATLLDEWLARACFPALPNQVAVTASLKIDFRLPCPANTYLVLKAHTTKVEGRKAWVEGWIETLGEGLEEGQKLVTAEGLFIEPRGAASFPKIG